MIYGFNHTTHGFHTVKHDTNTYNKILDCLAKTGKKYCVLKFSFGLITFSKDQQLIKDKQTLFMLHGNQS